MFYLNYNPFRKKLKFLFEGILLLMVAVASAFGNDSLKTIRTLPLVVNSSALSRSQLNYSSTTYIPDSIIRSINPDQVSDILIYSPGVFIKDYGGKGGIKTVSLRGAGSAQSVIMIDGMKLNTAQNGASDISIIPTAMINSAEVIRGGNSAIFGSNAISGVINLITDKFTTKRELGLSYGLFGNRFATANIKENFKIADHFIAPGITMEYNSTAGDFPIKVMNFGRTDEFTRTNGDFVNQSIALSLLHSYKNTVSSIKYIYRESARGVPGAVFRSKRENSLSRFDDKEHLAMINFNHEMEKHNLKSGVLFRNISSVFKDPLSGIENNRYSKFDENSVRTYFRMNSVINSDFFSMVNITNEYEFAYSNLQGDFLDLEAGNSAARILHAISTNTELRRSLKFINIDILFGARYDNFSDVGDNFSSTIALNLDIVDIPILIRSGVSRNFRAPSFNEMYYLNYGNSDLKPELSFNLFLGLDYNFLQHFKLSVDLFNNQIDNNIVSVPISPVEWQAQNIDLVNSRGIEFSLKANSILGIADIIMNYSLQESINKTNGSLFYDKSLPYVPNELFNGIINFRIYGFLFQLRAEYSSFRYSSSNEELNSVIDSYFILSARFQYQIETFFGKMDLFIESENILDEQYALIRNFPMPGFYLNGGIRINLNKL